jgi:hypothetical protein
MAKTDNGKGPNVKYSRYLIVESRMACSGCKGITAVYAFAVPAGYESCEVDDDTPDVRDGTWEASGIAARSRQPFLDPTRSRAWTLFDCIRCESRLRDGWGGCPTM